MTEGNLTKAIEFAQQNNRPILLYFNSIDCHGCEVFSSEVMANDSVVLALKNKYVCVNATVETRDGRKYSKKFKVYNLPQLVLLTPDQKVHFIVEMKLDKKHTIRQTNNFLSVGGMRDQVLLLQSTKQITWEEACVEIGASYARLDYRKNPDGQALEMVYDRTLNMEMFAKLNEAYLDEWHVQKRKNQ